MAVGHHDQQGVSFGQAAIGAMCGRYQSLDLIGRQMFARSADPIPLPQRW